MLMRRLLLCSCAAFWPLFSLAEPTLPGPDIAGVNFQWGVAIPMRDGVKLSAKMSHGVFYTYDMQWLLFTDGHTSQERVFADESF